MYSTAFGAVPFDAAPFALPLPEGNGLLWEDPREIHRVEIRFRSAPPETGSVRLEYWGSRWPNQHLPKDREPGGGDVGWMELGDWYRYGWRVADAQVVRDDTAFVFTFNPVSTGEFPDLKDYAASFRYTLKTRVVSDVPLPPIERFVVETDSRLEERTVRLVWRESPREDVRFEVFNGTLESVDGESSQSRRLRLRVAVNPDPNSFDRTLVTVRGADVWSFAVDDLEDGALFLPDFGVAVLPAEDRRDYQAVAAAARPLRGQSLVDRVAAHPEQTWRKAWEGMPRKRSDIYFPQGLDGGRQRFRLHADGSVDFRSNDSYLRGRPGRDTARLDLEEPGGRLEFALPDRPVFRTLVESNLPICVTRWRVDGVEVTQTALVTTLEGADALGSVPEGDVTAVWLAAFSITNLGAAEAVFRLPLRFNRGPLEVGDDGWLRARSRDRMHVSGDGRWSESDGAPVREWTLPPDGAARLLVKVPYVVLTGVSEFGALRRLNWDLELAAVSAGWRRRLDEGARLITPEPMLNEFYRSHAMHLLVNCEREPGSTRRFARVGSFGYGAYGNESCMMVVDLERRGYHREARECLDAWLHYQGSVGLPGDFASSQGVFYGAGGYEAGGYNQHHGWILWMLAEHYRFTRDRAWLERVAPGIVAGADWIIRETARTEERHPLERGLLPAGSLEDIGDWWTWLSTSCYMWRGLDHAAWALSQIGHAETARIRRAAQDYREALLKNFRQAAARSPVVRLRDGTAIPHFPSQVHRRGRSFGWICETLEGALHLLITRAIDPNAPEAEWILKDYEDNLFLSNQYGYTLDDFETQWFGRGGMSMQACLLLNVEPYLYRDDVSHALRGLFNGLAVSYFPDVRLNTEHALPFMDDWRGDHFKSSDEANAAGWLRYLFVREEGESLLIGQAVPREWLEAGQECGLERTGTWFGPVSVLYRSEADQVTVRLDGPTRNPPQRVRLRFRLPEGRRLGPVQVNGKRWNEVSADWVELPGDVGQATIEAGILRN